MTRVPLGKVLLRNVIRHTDAHNKIQEESDMWKIRELERQMEESSRRVPRRPSPGRSSRMRSDGFDEESRRADGRVQREMSGAPEDDALRARFWNRRLYECEAAMPDRWGHSGYKELYPEEFDTDSDQQEPRALVNGGGRELQEAASTRQACKRKKSKKSHKKKRKKRSHKKPKKSKKGPEEGADSSSSEGWREPRDTGTEKRHRPRKKVARKKGSKRPASSSSSSSSSSEPDGDARSSRAGQEGVPGGARRQRGERERRGPAGSRRSEPCERRADKRKNWKVATADAESDESSED
ncbi:uncharacterized protein NKAPD1 isoform X2 [Ornithorhynchus anatinus]|uniref:NKAP domain containing 1 n=1 Tax=Ornithorhynchus anatinus TaxID=9258 RepID=F6VX28_ORNAN|nr:uncharacterized protein NKAPD1 isoform X2 [Ornithorhynchus anatinus]